MSNLLKEQWPGPERDAMIVRQLWWMTGDALAKGIACPILQVDDPRTGFSSYSQTPVAWKFTREQ